MEPTLNSLLESKLEWIFVGGKGRVGNTTTACAITTLFAKSTIADVAAPGGQRRRRVLLISTDPAHNLSDAFNQRFGPQPTPVRGLEISLSAMEIDPAHVSHGSLLGLLPTSPADPRNSAEVCGGKSAQGDEANTTSLLDSASPPCPPPSSSAPLPSSPPAEVGEAARQRWMLARLSGVLREAAQSMPGIDELTVFEEIIHFTQHVSFDLLIFDTVPTGHALRMLAVPQTLHSAL